jgi:hypothetical protein
VRGRVSEPGRQWIGLPLTQGPGPDRVLVDSRGPIYRAFDAQSSEILGYGEQRYPLSRDLIGSIQRSSVDPILIVGSRKAVKPPEAQDHRNTTFPGQENNCRRTPRWAAPSRLRVLTEKTGAIHIKSQIPVRKEHKTASLSPLMLKSTKSGVIPQIPYARFPTRQRRSLGAV